MKIESGRPIGSSTGARKSGGAAAPGFAPPTDAPQRTSAAAAASATPSIDAILALQGEGLEPEQRRRRQVKRGQAALEALDALAKGLALGRAPASVKADLEALRRGAENTGEPGLDELMREIDTRVAVELAKLERA